MNMKKKKKQLLKYHQKERLKWAKSAMSGHDEFLQMIIFIKRKLTLAAQISRNSIRLT